MPRRAALNAISMPGMRRLLARMGASDVRIERREHAVGIVTEQPDMAVEMRLEMVRLVEPAGGAVGHMLLRNAMEAGPRGPTRRAPGGFENQIFDGDQLHRSISLRLVAQDRGIQEIGVSAVAVHARVGRGGDAEP